MNNVLQYHSSLSVLLLLSAALMVGCDQQQAQKIQWQLPLQTPEDPHGGNQNMAVPDWATARQGEAELVWLQKSTTKMVTTKLALGGRTMVKGWEIQLLGLASGLRLKDGAFLNDESVHNAAALVAISRDGKIVYRGWLYENFPELFGIDDPEWKVWLKGITLRPALREG